MLEILFLVLTVVQSAYSRQANVYHRLLHAAEPSLSPKFTYKGTIELDTTTNPAEATYSPSNSLNNDFSNILTKFNDPSGALYQVALEIPGEDQDAWPFTSIKACHLPTASGERIWLHVSSSNVPYSLGYWLNDIPNNGACPPSPKGIIDMGSFNTTVAVKSPNSPPSPQLRIPPQLSAEGRPVEPEQEKTFLQKYWMHLLGGFLLITFLAPAPEEGGEGQQQSGGSAK